MRKAHYIALGFVLLLTLGLLRFPDRADPHVKPAVASLFVPLFGLAGSVERLAGRTSQALTPKRKLGEENERLRRENAELRMRLVQVEEAARENDRLRALIGWARSAPWKGKPARVIARDPANWWRSLHISLGRRDGVAVDAVVLTPEGLVGRVVEVSELRSRVALLGDPACRVAVLVMEGRQVADNGVISGSASVTDSSMVELSYLSPSREVKPGQSVLTSGLGGVFPKGILAGQVIYSHPIEFGLYKKARVKLAVNLDRLEEVWVTTP